MKRNFFASLLATSVAAVALAPAVGLANSGTINFSGTISDVTCDINGQPGGPNNLTDVHLGTVSPDDVTAGIAPVVPFSLKLSGAGCTDGRKVAISFDPIQNIDLATGNLQLLGTQAATGVQIQISNNGNGKSNKIVLGQSETDPQMATIAGNSAELMYAAQYVAAGAGSVSAGSGQSFVRYVLAYD